MEADPSAADRDNGLEVVRLVRRSFGEPTPNGHEDPLDTSAYLRFAGVAQLRDGRKTLLHQASGPTPIIVDEGERPTEHHPAGSETRSQASEDVLANNREQIILGGTA